jgi:hypothetical protein
MQLVVKQNPVAPRRGSLLIGGKVQSKHWVFPTRTRGCGWSLLLVLNPVAVPWAAQPPSENGFYAAASNTYCERQFYFVILRSRELAFSMYLACDVVRSRLLFSKRLT